MLRFLGVFAMFLIAPIVLIYAILTGWFWAGFIVLVIGYGAWLLQTIARTYLRWVARRTRRIEPWPLRLLAGVGWIAVGIVFAVLTLPASGLTSVIAGTQENSAAGPYGLVWLAFPLLAGFLLVAAPLVGGGWIALSALTLWIRAELADASGRPMRPGLGGLLDWLDAGARSPEPAPARH